MADMQSRQEDSHALHLGILLFGDDFEAIYRVLLPAYEENDLVHLYSNCVHTTAAAYVTELRASGLQPGSLLSGNARIQLIKALTAAAGRNLASDRTVSAAFKAYDSCSLPLLSLAEVLEQAAGADRLVDGLLAALPSCCINPERLTDLSTCLSWDALQSKLQQQPGLFDSCIWPCLSAQGWQLQDSSSPTVLVPPASAAAAYHASTGHHVAACSSPQQVLALLQQIQQPVPEECVQWLREAEAEVRVAAVLASAAQTQFAPHRVCPDPSGRLAGLPTTRRRLMCANCGVSSTRVWRVANAGLMCCNACGMFYQKHHRHRPEHLLAANRAKHEAMQASAAAVGLYAHTDAAQHLPDGGAWSDAWPKGWLHSTAGGAGAAASDDLLDGSSGPTASKRQRTRRQPQVNRRFASEDFLVLEGPLAQLQAGGVDAAGVSSDGEAWDSDGGCGGAGVRNRRYTNRRLEQADEELEGLLQRILGDRPDTSAVCEESAVATLVHMRRSKLASGTNANASPAAGAAGSVFGPLQHGLTVDAYALLVASLASSLAGGSTAASVMPAGAPAGPDMLGGDGYQHQRQQSLPPIAQLHLPATATMAEVWAQLQQQGIPSHSRRHASGADLSPLGSFAEHDMQSPSDVEQVPQFEDTAMTDWQQPSSSHLQGYGASLVIDDGALVAISEQSLRLQQQLASAAGSLLNDTHYQPSAYGGSSNSSYAGAHCSQHDGSITGSPSYFAQAAAAFCRQSSNNSSGSGFSMERYNSGVPQWTAMQVQTAGGLGMSRFASEQQRASFNSPPSPARRSPAKPRSSGKRRDGQPSCCANCACESSCLWRRDKFEPSRVLCNACGIYKATNGIDRPMTPKFAARRTSKPVTAQRMGSPSGRSDRHPAAVPRSPARHTCATQGPRSPSAAQVAAASAFPRSPKPAAAAPLDFPQAGGGTYAAGAFASSMQIVQAAAPATISHSAPPARKAIAVLDLSTPVTEGGVAGPGPVGSQEQYAALDSPEICVDDGAEPSSQAASEALLGVMHQRYQQQQQQQQQGDATNINCIEDPHLKQQLLGVWGHAQSLQQPIVCAASGYRVYPDGRCTRVSQPELKAALPYLQRHSSSNSARSNLDLSAALLRGSSTAGSISTALALPGASNGQGLALGLHHQ